MVTSSTATVPGDGQGQCKAVCNTFHCYKGGPAEGEGTGNPWKCAVFVAKRPGLMTRG